MELLADETFVVFLMATHGEGDPTDNAIGFYEYLKDKDREEDELKNVKFSCFGLGRPLASQTANATELTLRWRLQATGSTSTTTRWERYAAKHCRVSCPCVCVGDDCSEPHGLCLQEFNKHMTRLGAQIVGEYGEGDDNEDLDGDYNAWLEKTVPAIVTEFLGADAANASASGPQELEYLLTLHDETEMKTNPASTEGIIDKHKWLPATLTTVRELQDKQQSGRSTLHVELSGPDNTDYARGPYAYEPGDHVAVRCENNPKLVAALGSRLNADLNKWVTLKAKPGSVCPTYRFPSPCLLRDVFAKYLDICTPPSQEVLRGLAPYAQGAEKEALEALSHSKNKAAYKAEIVEPCLTLLEVLDMFGSLEPDLAAVLELLPRLASRFYSISSSPSAVKDAIHLTVAVVRYGGGKGTVGDREGVASTWFERMRTGRQFDMYMNTADFKLPKDHATPVVMVGPGTGLAPFRGFIQDRQAHRQAHGSSGEMVMIFGCRSKSYDYIYQKELEAAEADGTLTKLLCAFSRDQKEKVYVQHLVEQHQEMLWRMLVEEKGHFYICGDAANMAADVQAAVGKAFERAGGLSPARAEDKMQELKAAGRFQLDVWA